MSRHLALQIDQDGDGFILRSELRRYLLATPVSEVPLSDDMVDAMLYHVDYNNDGFINLQEFYGLVSVPRYHFLCSCGFFWKCCTSSALVTCLLVYFLSLFGNVTFWRGLIPIGDFTVASSTFSSWHFSFLSLKYISAFSFFAILEYCFMIIYSVFILSFRFFFGGRKLGIREIHSRKTDKTCLKVCMFSTISYLFLRKKKSRNTSSLIVVFSSIPSCCLPIIVSLSHLDIFPSHSFPFLIHIPNMIPSLSFILLPYPSYTISNPNTSTLPYPPHSFPVPHPNACLPTGQCTSGHQDQVSASADSGGHCLLHGPTLPGVSWRSSIHS